MGTRRIIFLTLFLLLTKHYWFHYFEEEDRGDASKTSIAIEDFEFQLALLKKEHTSCQTALSKEETRISNFLFAFFRISRFNSIENNFQMFKSLMKTTENDLNQCVSAKKSLAKELKSAEHALNKCESIQKLSMAICAKLQEIAENLQASVEPIQQVFHSEMETKLNRSANEVIIQ